MSVLSFRIILPGFLSAALIFLFVFWFFKDQRSKADLIIKNVEILSFDSKNQILSDSAIAVKNGLILEIGSDSKISGSYHAETVIDGEGSYALPGFVNTHSHVSTGPMAGLFGSFDMTEWWKDARSKELKYLNEKSAFECAYSGFIKLLSSGVTTVNDMSFFAEQTARAAEETGIRANLAETLISGSSPSYNDFEEALDKVDRLRRRTGQNPLLRTLMGLHGFQTLHTRHISRSIKYAQRHHLQIHMHFEESASEELFKELIEQRRRIEFLNALPSEISIIAAHGVKLSSENIKLLDPEKISVSINLSSNYNLGVGFPPLLELFNRGIELSIGTDGEITNPRLDFFEEMRLIFKSSRLKYRSKSPFDAKTILEMATIGGARSLKMEDSIGSIERGKRADIILLKMRGQKKRIDISPYEQILNTADNSNLFYLFVDGRALIEGYSLSEKLVRKAPCVESL